jgi:hypothetical protein
LHGAARGAAVTQQNQVRIGRGRRSALREACGECGLQVRAAAESARANKFQRFFDRRGIGSHGRGLEPRNLRVEKQKIEAVGGLQRMQDALERVITAFQFLPLHRERSVEEQDHRFWRSGR